MKVLYYFRGPDPAAGSLEEVSAFMIYKIYKPLQPLDASVELPVSKSISNRQLIIHALSGSGTYPGNLSDSDDTRVMVRALASKELTRDVGHAGTSMRFLTAYFSSRQSRVHLTGSKRMKQRPIGPLVDALRELGANIDYLEKDGSPPLEIRGKLLPGGEITIDGSISSQFISALLMIGPMMKNGLKIRLAGEVVSGSYIRMTLELMRQNGVHCHYEGNTITVPHAVYRVSPREVESDWSAASYWYSMAYLDKQSRVELAQLRNEGLQGDSALVNIFHGLGLVSSFEGNRLRLKRLGMVHPGTFSYDFTNAPDIVQSMAVTLCLAGIPFRFTGTRTLRIKETDRILALQNELRKLGFVLGSDREGSYLAWNGETCDPQPDPVIETYHDHRMAMAFAPAALVRGTIAIYDPLVVTKSYPAFWENLKRAGFGLKVEG